MTHRNPNALGVDAKDEVTDPRKVSRRSPWYWIALMLFLAGDVAILAALYLPWVELFKPSLSLSFPTRRYSPWNVLERGQGDGLGILTGLYFFVTVGLVALSFLYITMWAARARSYARLLALITAIAGLALALSALAGLPTVSLEYPYYDTSVLYGGAVAVGGLLAILLAIAVSE
jgi:vacuolar-type H+-ATPase subunit I/STV1